MRILTIALILLAQDREKKKVMCTLPVLQSIAGELAGDDAEIVALSKPDQNPHSVDPNPTLMEKLRAAELFVEIGLQLELWADEIANGSGNSKVTKGARGRLVASSGIPREEVPSVVTRAEGDIHPEGNPHIWLDPLRAKGVAENIAAGLIELLPARKAAIEERLAKFRDRIDEALFGAELLKAVGSKPLCRKAADGTLIAWLEEKKLSGKLGGWMKKAAPLRGAKVVEFHKTWIYVAKLFAFQLVGSIEPKPGITPGPKHLGELRETIKSAGVKVILVETYQALGTPKALAADMGIKVAVVPTQPGGESDAGDYFKLIDTILDRILEASK
jgi:ABC-type Zn uptake system ZnuABC Zn-binding protein ZnuA